MIDPVLRSIDCEWVLFHCASVNLATKIEQGVAGNSGKIVMGRMGKDVIAGEVLSHIGKARRH